MGDVAALVCALSFAIFMLALALVTLKLARSVSITNRILNDIRHEAVPLLTKLQTTMDHVNEEMARVDGVLGSVEEVAGRINAASKAAQKALTSPLTRLLALGMGARRAIGTTSSGGKEGQDEERG